MMSTNTEKNSAVSEEGHVLTAYGFIWSFGQYADQELLKSLFQNKIPDLSLKYILIQVHDQQGHRRHRRCLKLVELYLS